MPFYDLYLLCAQNCVGLNDCALGRQDPLFLLTQRYINLFANRFTYDGLQEETEDMTAYNNRMELMVFFARAVAWFKDPVLGVQCLPTTGAFKYNMSGIPTEWKVFGVNGYRKDLTDKDSVLMPNDYAFSIPFLEVLYNVRFMIDCDKTHRQNLHAMRQPLLMELEEDEKLSAANFLKQLDDFTDTIKVRKRVKDKRDKRTLDDKPFDTKVFASGAQFIGDKLIADYRFFENRIFTYFGYNNENMEKKERLLVDEVNANNSVLNSNFTVGLTVRKKALEKVNKMFGTNITIKPTEMKGVDVEPTQGELNKNGQNVPASNNAESDTNKMAR